MLSIWRITEMKRSGCKEEKLGIYMQHDILAVRKE